MNNETNTNINRLTSHENLIEEENTLLKIGIDTNEVSRRGYATPLERRIAVVMLEQEFGLRQVTTKWLKYVWDYYPHEYCYATSKEVVEHFESGGPDEMWILSEDLQQDVTELYKHIISEDDIIRLETLTAIVLGEIPTRNA